LCPFACDETPLRRGHRCGCDVVNGLMAAAYVASVTSELRFRHTFVTRAVQARMPQARRDFSLRKSECPEARANPFLFGGRLLSSARGRTPWDCGIGTMKRCCRSW